MASESLTFDIFANDRASETFKRIGQQATDASGNVRGLGDRLDKLGSRVATARVALEGDKDAQHQLDVLTERLIRLGRRAANPNISVEGYARTMADISAVSLALDKLNDKKATPNIFTKAAGASALAPSVGGTALALTPALIPVAAGLSAAVTGIAVSFGAAAAGAGAFGLLAVSALKQAGTAASAVETAQTTYSAAIASGTKKATAYAAEQRAISVAYAGMSKQQIELSKTVGLLAEGWDSVKASLTPVISGALVPWLGAVEQATQFIKPVVAPVAGIFQAWGEALTTYFADPAVVKHIQGMASAFGQFSATQLGLIGQFILNIGKGIYNLGKDLGGAGFNISAAGTWLTGMGAGFLTWSKSANARKDVNTFMKFLSDNGPVIKSVLKDLAKDLPGIWAGATAVGTLELRALNDLLNTIAKLPPGWQKPITEFAGAMLLLSKTGVVSVGLKLVGTTAGGAGLGGAAIAGGLVLKIREDLKKGITAIIPDVGKWFTGVGGILGLSAQGWADTIVAKFSKPLDQFAAPVRAKITGWFKGAGSWLVASGSATITGLWNGIRADWRPFAAWMAGWRSRIAGYFAAALNWLTGPGRNIITGMWNGVSGRWGAVASWFGGMAGRIGNYGRGALGWLSTAGANIMWGLYHGITGIWNNVLGWFKGLPSRILHAMGFKSPPGWAVTAGKQIMQGILNGINLTHGSVLARAQKITNQLGNAFGDTGARSGSASLAQSFAASVLPRGWSFPALLSLWNQESGWSAYAVNPSSGAYGIPQSLGHGHPYALGDYKAQIMWGINYIAGRYGNSQNAWAHEVANNWYDQGGWLPTGVSLAVNRTGRPERILSPRESAGAATTIIVRVDPVVAAATPSAHLGQHIGQHVTAAIRSGMRLYPPGVAPR